MSNQPTALQPFPKSWTVAWWQRIWLTANGRKQAGIHISAQERRAWRPLVLSWGAGCVLLLGLPLLGMGAGSMLDGTLTGLIFLLIGVPLTAVMNLGLLGYRYDAPLGTPTLGQYPGTAATRYDDYLQWRQQP